MRRRLALAALAAFVLAGCSAISGGDAREEAASVCRDYAVFWLDVGDAKYTIDEMGEQMTSLQERARATGDTALTRYLEGMYDSATDEWSTLTEWASMAVRVAETCETYGVAIATSAP
jgi:hypothetical protein